MLYNSTAILSAKVLFDFYKGLPLRDRSFPVHEEETYDVDSSEYQEGAVDLQTLFHVQVCLGGGKQEDVAHGGRKSTGYTPCPAMHKCIM